MPCIRGQQEYDSKDLLFAVMSKQIFFSLAWLTDFGTLITKGRISFDASLFFSGPQKVSGKSGISVMGLELHGRVYNINSFLCIY